ncbi:hypothetical protein, putative phage tail protein [Sulfurovum sp. enrichment culture clone C5]|uniref:Phage tail tape measure protein domain-containing protein n=1 Tax=Sulfurovum sp. enrichment culture clone C5 TaxID=497650 RepID=A0A0S4XLP8_9BACT|nr:hypothetical protein, putative phage tail protein [Sulfurovum sp. enrichment culture clone C5]
MSNMDVGLTFKALDNASPVIAKVWGEVKKLTNAPIRIGLATTFVGNALKNYSEAKKERAMSYIKPYADLEDARTQLENTMLKSNGKVSAWFSAIDKEATELGNKLPGTTADFYEMASAMKSLGVEEKTIANGGLKSAAYLAAVLKIPYAEAAESVAKFKEALGIADKDLIAFIDDMQRMGHMGVKVDEMKYAFGRSAGALKLMGLQGLQASRDLEPLYGMLIKTGMSGETVGTAVGNALQTAMTFEVDRSKKVAELRAMLNARGITLDFVDDTGKFKGIDNMVAQLEKLKKIKSEAERVSIIQSIFGSGAEGDAISMMLKQGSSGIAKFKADMAAQANLDKRVEKSLGTLRALWEAFSGTKDNVFASVVEQWSGEIHWLTKALGSATATVGNFSKAHPIMTKFFGAIILGAPLVAGVLGAIMVPLGLITTGFGVLKKITGFSTLKNALTGVGKTACDAGNCAGGAATKIVKLKNAMSGIGAIGFAEAAGIAALATAFVALNWQIAEMGKADIGSKHIQSMSLAELKQNKQYLQERIDNSKKDLTTFGGFKERVWQGTDQATAKALEARLKATNAALSKLDPGLKKSTTVTKKTKTNPTYFDKHPMTIEAIRAKAYLEDRKKLLTNAKNTIQQTVKNDTKTTQNNHNTYNTHVVVQNSNASASEIAKMVDKKLKANADRNANLSLKKVK